MNLLLDTCVVIDYLGRKEPFFPAAERVMAAGYFGDARLWVAGQSLNDAFYVLRRYKKTAQVQQAIREMLEAVNISVPSPADYAKALQLEWNDLEDCLIALTADQTDADYLITRDKSGFKRSMVPALSPKEWLEHMREEHRLVYDAIDF